MFARIVSAAAIAGVLSGLLLTALQRLEVAPLIRAAEVLEGQRHSHSAHQASHPDAAAAASATSDEIERLLSTTVANVALTLGFALLIGAAMSLRGHAGWQAGALWGIAGFVALYAAPSLGLPPELPGADAAPLNARTLWWVVTAVATSAGLWSLAFGKTPLLRVAGIALIVAPHGFGAPLPLAHTDTIPAAMANQFVRATAMVNAASWLVLGVVLGIALKRQLSISSAR
jgi:cobalt transporter subunit CbtA